MSIFYKSKMTKPSFYDPLMPFLVILVGFVIILISCPFCHKYAAIRREKKREIEQMRKWDEQIANAPNYQNLNNDENSNENTTSGENTPFRSPSSFQGRRQSNYMMMRANQSYPNRVSKTSVNSQTTST